VPTRSLRTQTSRSAKGNITTMEHKHFLANYIHAHISCIDRRGRPDLPYAKGRIYRCLGDISALSRFDCVRRAHVCGRIDILRHPLDNAILTNARVDR
jgi:hypothetical protein